MTTATTLQGQSSGRRVFEGDELTEEVARAALSFRYFLRHHVYIADRTPDGQLLGVLKWQWWHIHDDICDALDHEPRLAILKARQLGLSWLLAAWHLHGAMFTPNYLGGVVSAGETEAAEFLSKCAFILAHLPYATIPTLTTENKSELRFKTTGGAIRAFPSTPNAGRGYTFSRFVADEAAFHEHAGLNYEAYSIAAEYGQIVIVSSAGSDEAKGAANPWFQRFWLSARDGLNGFSARFFAYGERPGRDVAWYEREQRRLSARPGAMAREFPRTPEEAFRSMLALRFNVDMMDHARAACRPPLTVYNLPDGVNTATLQGATLRLWALPRPGIPYVAYSEAAEGKGRDYTVTMIAEARTLRHVCTLRDNVLEPGQHAAIAAALARWYNTALWGVERNRGEAVLYVAGQTGYPRLYRHNPNAEGQRRAADGTLATSSSTVGFPVNGQTRTGLIDDLAEAIADGALASDDDVFWSEGLTFVVTEAGRAEAASGMHDDTVMCMAGLVRMARQPGAQSAILSGDRRGSNVHALRLGAGGRSP